jgi:hypothetical protein
MEYYPLNSFDCWVAALYGRASIQITQSVELDISRVRGSNPLLYICQMPRKSTFLPKREIRVQVPSSRLSKTPAKILFRLTCWQ